MRRWNSLLIATLVTMLAAPAALAGGFLIYEHGASATGMASARTAAAGEPSALYYNPAAISELPGFQFQLGITPIIPSTHYEAAGTNNLREYISGDGTAAVNDGMNSVDAKFKVFTPIHLYATYNIESIGLTVGYSLNNPFGLGSFWPKDWDGRFMATAVEIQTFFNQPTVAVDIAQLAGFKDSFKLSVAAGYNLVYGTALLEKGVDLRVGEANVFGGFDNPWGHMKMHGSAIGHGWNVALYAEIPEWFSFGASVRGEISMPFSGNADFSFNQAGLDARAALAGASGLAPEEFLPDKDGGKITIDLPMNMNFGVAFIGVPNLRIEFDFFIAFFESYKELDLQFDCVKEGTCAALATQEPLVKNWKESMQFSLAGEYLLMDMLFIRAGYGMVTSPVPTEYYDPSLPDGRRDLICFGLGVQGDWWKVDLGYMLAMWEGTKSHEDGNFVGEGSTLAGDPGVNEDGSFLSPMLGNPEGFANGTYTTITHLISMSFTGRF